MEGTASPGRCEEKKQGQLGLGAAFISVLGAPKIMASGPITSWEIDGETVSDFIFWGSKITADGDCSHEIKRRLLLGITEWRGGDKSQHWRPPNTSSPELLDLGRTQNAGRLAASCSLKEACFSRLL